MPDPLSTISTRRTVQTVRADPRQVKNSAGGYTFQLGDDARIHRFLTLGTTGGTYYTGEKDLTKTNTDLVLHTARTRGVWLVEQLVAVSTAGRAPKQNPAIFALAAVAGLGDDEARKTALAALPVVCRTGTHLFLFTQYVENFRGWGRGLRNAVGGWFLDKPIDDIAYQAVKYRQREGWSMRDLLRLAHPEPAAGHVTRKQLFEWIARGTVGEDMPDLVRAFVHAQEATKVKTWEMLIGEFPLSWEMLPDTALSEPKVWRALIAKGMPQTALIRQLPRLTRLGVLEGDTLRTVVAQLVDPTRLRKARVHPVNLLVALRTYASGKSAAGKGEWTPKRQIVDALDAAFYQAFQTIVPAGKRTLLALDVSGSMSWGSISGMPVTPREVTAALALVTMASEPDTTVVGFTAAGGRLYQSGISELAISPRQRLDDAIKAISDLSFGSTDCSLPMVWAEQTKQEFDTIAVFTDNETYAGAVHPHQALESYRQKTGIPVRQVVVGMTATDFSIADPADPGTLDIAGFDSAVPNLLADFSRGDV